MGTLLFCDSYDHYGPESGLKWSVGTPEGTIDLTGTASRTGIGCFILGSGAFGPTQVFAAQPRIVFGTAFYPDGAGGGGIVQCFDTFTNNRQVQLSQFADLSIGVLTANEVLLGQSASNIMQQSSYNYVELDAQISHSATVIVRVNGLVVLTLVGVNTQVGGSNPFVNSCQILGISPQSSRHDDTYIVSPDPGSPMGSQFLGPVKIYAQVPVANASPLQWTPVPGVPNFQNVAEIPPDGDTSYNSADTVGLTDQYQYNATGVPLLSSILGLQHVMDLRVAVGSRTVASDFEGTVGPQMSLTSNYHMLSAPYSLNPASEGEWSLSDFPLNFGPRVTA